MPETSPRPQPEIVYSWFAEEERADGRGFRISLLVAVVVHLAILFATIPTLASKEIEKPEDKKYVKLAPTPKFKKDPPIKKERPEPRKAKIPMPDPTPDEIEIYVTEEIPDPDLALDIDDEIPFDLPDAPPAPPEVPLRVGAGIEPPVRVHFVQPAYTEIARKARIEGMVIIETLIDKKGRVTDSEVLKGLGFGLTEEALKAVHQWKFEASVMNGKPVEIVYVVTVHFRLN